MWASSSIPASIKFSYFALKQLLLVLNHNIKLSKKGLIQPGNSYVPSLVILICESPFKVASLSQDRSFRYIH